MRGDLHADTGNTGHPPCKQETRRVFRACGYPLFRSGGLGQCLTPPLTKSDSSPAKRRVSSTPQGWPINGSAT